MAGPNDPNGDDDQPIVAPEPPEVSRLHTGGGETTDRDAAGAERAGTGGSGPQDGEK